MSAAKVISKRGNGMNKTLEQRLLKLRARLEKTLFNALPERLLIAVDNIACSLVNSTTGTLTLDEYRSLVKGLDKEDIQLIDTMNIFLIKPWKISFYSRLTKHYFESLYKEKLLDNEKSL